MNAPFGTNTRRRLNLGRAALLLGLGIGLLSWRESVGHIGDPDFLLRAFGPGSTHAWYHVFREACRDLAKMAVLLLCFFGPERWRTPVTWWIGLVLMLGYYAPFWLGMPFHSALSAPNAIAEAIHVGMALFALLGLALARPAFRTGQQAAA